MSELIYPAFAFVMVICTPSLIALWAIYKTWTEKDTAC